MQKDKTHEEQKAQPSKPPEDVKKGEEEKKKGEGNQKEADSKKEEKEEKIKKPRKLASVRKVDSVEPFEGKNAIEIATVGGWTVVVPKKLGLKKGDFVVYCEIDSILPKWKMFEFMAKQSYRLKSVKMFGKMTQGLIISFEDLGKIENPSAKYIPDQRCIEYSKEEEGVKKQTKILLEEGVDLTEVLQIEKYEEAQIPSGSSQKASFRHWPFRRMGREIKTSKNSQKSLEELNSL